MRPNTPHAPARPVATTEFEPGTDVEIVAHVEQYDDEPDECTLYPAFATDTNRVTTWLSAEAGSFVSLEQMR